MTKIDLLKRAQYSRTNITRGLAASEESVVSRAGGQFESGLIRGVAVLTRGEAKGHRMWIDSTFLDEVHSAINSSKKGVKARFTHPGLSSDGLGKYLGKFRNAYRDGDSIRAELHFAASAHDTPDGDLAGYVMDLAEESPEDFGTSIVFEPDYGAEDSFEAMNRDEKGSFRSPDKDNVHNYRHARLHILRATDVVDEPAANPEGLFHATDIPQQAEDLISYALGLSADLPDSELLGVDPDRLAGFVRRYLARNNLQITGADMGTAGEANLEAVEDVTAEENEITEATQEDEASEVADTDALPEVEPSETETDTGMSAREELKRFMSVFGPQGAEWYADGVTFEEATAKYSAQLKEENERLKKLLDQSRGESEALSGGLEETPANAKERDLQTKVGDNRAKYAAAIKLNTSKN